MHESEGFPPAPGLSKTEAAPLEAPIGEGDDDALIVWFLGLTLSERFAVAQDFLDSVHLLRNGLRS